MRGDDILDPLRMRRSGLWGGVDTLLLFLLLCELQR